MPNLRKLEITIDFNGNVGHLYGVISLVNVAETFTDFLKYHFLQMNAAKLAKYTHSIFLNPN